ncbi:MAG: hypothetical protein ACOC0N_00760 [Chroococcales cyanobacterium]
MSVITVAAFPQVKVDTPKSLPEKQKSLPRHRLVAQWVKDENSRLVCHWISDNDDFSR